jgi:lipopolysaccharide/colanic/teichoic acid biosynthesis glycosyltransferase
MIVLLLIPMLVITIAVKLGSPGPVLYRQVRITQYGRKFKICKFRTMYDEAGKIDKTTGQQVGSAVTVANDSRVTKVGKVLRKYRLDEFPQLFNVLAGDMSFVGTRPEVPKYVDKYEEVYYATLLLPAGIMSECSIRYKDEDKLLGAAEDVDKVYVEQVLPGKMKINLKSIKHISLGNEALTMFRTVAAVAGKDYE